MYVIILNKRINVSRYKDRSAGGSGNSKRVSRARFVAYQKGTGTEAGQQSESSQIYGVFGSHPAWPQTGNLFELYIYKSLPNDPLPQSNIYVLTKNVCYKSLVKLMNDTCMCECPNILLQNWVKQLVINKISSCVG